MLLEIDFEDRKWDLDLDEIGLGEARTIQRNTGKGLSDFTRGCIREGDPDCLAWLFWLMHKQNGEKAVDPNRMDIKVAQLWSALLESLEAAAAEEANAPKKDDAKKTPKDPA